MPTRTASGSTSGKICADISLHDRKCCKHRALGVVLMRLGPTEIDEDPVAQQLGDITPVVIDRASSQALIGAQNLAQILRIEALAERGGTHQVDEHHGQLPPLGLSGSGAFIEFARSGTKRGQGLQQPLTVAQTDAELFQVVIVKVPEHVVVDVVLAKDLLVPTEAEALKPSGDVHP